MGERKLIYDFNELQLEVVYKSSNQNSKSVQECMSVDPLANEFTSWSSYNYCLGNPIIFTDPDGRSASPIYDRNGELLGTDDQGLKGDAIIMKKEEFVQGMEHEEALTKQLGFKGLNNAAAETKFAESFESLSSRPDYNGSITLPEANNWFNNGNGKPLFVDASKIDLSPVKKSDFSKVGSSFYKNFALPPTTVTGFVYGTIKLTLESIRVDKTGAVKLGGDNGLLDICNFDYKKVDGAKTAARNVLTWFGETLAGEGTKFNIYSYGRGTVR
jgi:hypothetical protein